MMKNLVCMMALLAAALWAGYADAQEKDGVYLKKDTLKTYLPCDEKELRENPKNYVNRKVRVELSFVSRKKNLAAVNKGAFNETDANPEFDPDIPGSYSLRKNLVLSSYYHFARENLDVAVPIIVNIREKTKLIPFIEKIKDGDELYIYGKFKLYTPNFISGQDKGRKEHILDVDDVTVKKFIDKEKVKDKDEKEKDEKEKEKDEKAQPAATPLDKKTVNELKVLD